MKHIGEKIKEVRKSKRLYQKEVAKTAGISTNSLCTIERGGNTTIDTLNDIGKALGRTLVMDLVE